MSRLAGARGLPIGIPIEALKQPLMASNGGPAATSWDGTLLHCRTTRCPDRTHHA